MNDDPRTRSERADQIRRLITAEGATVSKNVQHFNSERYRAVADLDDWERLKTKAREIKEDAIDQLPTLIESVTHSVTEHGGHVYLADDAASANRYICDVCESVGATSVVKSKSMTTEELEVNDALFELGCEVYETDLGELILQIADESPSHLVGPSLHKSRRDIARLFSHHFDLDEPLETAEELTTFARDYLTPKFAEADVGMTGANFVVAETGSIVLVTNEGNARKVFETTNTHIAVAGIEKLVPTLADLQPFLELLARSGTGQSLTEYTSIISPPIGTPPFPFDGGSDGMADEPPEQREFHLVLVDNGRSSMVEDDVLRETLYCIRCGACANACANFQHVGGHAFGGETYTGGIATGWETGVHGVESAATFNDLCTGCTRCVTQCPVKIDIAWINTAIRDRINRGHDPQAFDFLIDGLVPDSEVAGIPLQKRFFGNFASVARIGSATAPLSNWLADSTTCRMALDWLVGIDPRRDLPRFRRETFRDWFEARAGGGPSDPVRRVVILPDPYTNFVQCDRGIATVRTLEALDVAVDLAPVSASGRAPLSQGMIDTATKCARTVASELIPAIENDVDVIVIEPSDCTMFQDDYRRLLPEDDSLMLAENTYEVMEYVYDLLVDDEMDPSILRSGSDPLVYHPHCQQRSLGGERDTIAVLETLGYDVETTGVECCGMAGSFGYKSEYYELSMDVGRDLEHQLRKVFPTRQPVASGASCVDQIETLIGERPLHPVEVIEPN